GILAHHDASRPRERDGAEASVDDLEAYKKLAQAMIGIAGELAPASMVAVAALDLVQRDPVGRTGGHAGDRGGWQGQWEPSVVGVTCPMMSASVGNRKWAAVTFRTPMPRFSRRGPGLAAAF